MCGIAGIVSLRGELPPNDTRIDAMSDTLRHRGPNHYGKDSFPAVHFGMRRLSIIDLNGGNQPIYNEDRNICVIFNGEIYNFRELRRDLRERGHRMDSNSDGAVIPHLYEEYGTDFAFKLNGMFAIALYHRPSGKVHLIRDRFGIKPLYYATVGRELVFGSEVKAILAHGSCPRRLDANAFAEFMAWEYVPSPSTLFEDIRKIEPGGMVSVNISTGIVASQRWWTPEMTAGEVASIPRPRSEGEWIEAVDAAITTAVKRQLVSDVPLGVLLSGGVDSSLIASAMPGALAFTMGFADGDYSEVPWANRIAEHLGLRQIIEIAHPESGTTLQQLVEHLDDPLGDFSILPTYLVSRLAGKSVTVVLSGDGGDELFGGYEAYLAQSIADKYRRLPGPLRLGIRAALMATPSNDRKSSMTHRLKRLIDGMTGNEGLYHTRWRLRMGDDEHPSYLSEQFIGLLTRSGGAHVVEGFASYPGMSGLNKQLCVDMGAYLTDNCLAKVDRMSMACSIEVRVPFLDNDVVGLALQMPERLKLSGMTTKRVLKKIATRHVPKNCVYRPKQGFSLPMGQWMRSVLRPMVEETLAPDRLRQQGIFNVNGVQRLKAEHFEGIQDHAHLLWNMVVFESWAARWMGI